jgi:hypothetical protein
MFRVINNTKSVGTARQVVDCYFIPKNAEPVRHDHFENDRWVVIYGYEDPTCSEYVVQEVQRY